MSKLNGHKSNLQENLFYHQQEQLLLILIISKHIIPKLNFSVNIRWTQIDRDRK